jgi:hypothetical protein
VSGEDWLWLAMLTAQSGVLVYCARILQRSHAMLAAQAQLISEQQALIES